MVAGMINQKRLAQCFDRLARLDNHLAGEGVLINNGRMRRYSIVLLLLMLLFEAIITVYSFVAFEEEFNAWSLIWFITTIPTALNSVCRIWYVMLVSAIRQRFNAMNAHMNAIAHGILHYKDQYAGEPDADIAEIPLDYLEKEIFTVYTQRRKQLTVATPPKKTNANATTKVITVKPYQPKQPASPPLKPSVTPPPPHRNGAIQPWPAGADAVGYGPAQEFLPTDRRLRPHIEQRLDNKLILFCRTHDELCEIGKVVNRMYSVQMLVAMAHGFVAITAEFYFLYCSLTQQDVPILFRTAEVFLLGLAYIVYTALKCIVPIFVCWRTKTDSQRTGIELHYLANAVDEVHCYEVVNHLSLKLLNHQLNFSACGFFDLDMTTLYAVSSNGERCLVGRFGHVSKWYFGSLSLDNRRNHQLPDHTDPVQSCSDTEIEQQLNDRLECQHHGHGGCGGRRYHRTNDVRFQLKPACLLERRLSSVSIILQTGLSYFRTVRSRTGQRASTERPSHRICLS